MLQVRKCFLEATGVNGDIRSQRKLHHAYLWRRRDGFRLCKEILDRFLDETQCTGARRKQVPELVEVELSRTRNRDIQHLERRCRMTL